MNKERKPLRLNMQFFADDVAQTEQEGQGQAENNQGQANQEEDKKLNFDELARSNKEFQSWLDRERTKSNQTAIENFKKKQELLASEKATEDEKLKAMTEKERIAYEAKQKDNEIEQLKHQIAVTKLKEQVLTLGNEKKIPNELLELINYDTLKAEEVEDTLKGIEETFNKAVADAVAKNLSGAGTLNGKADKVAETNINKDTFPNKKWNRFNY